MNPNRTLITLNDFILNDLKNYPNATGAFSGLLRDIAFAAKRVHVQVNNSGIADILALTGKMNIQGEEVHQLDEFANKLFINTLKNGIDCAGIGSEEEKDIIIFDTPLNNQSPYVVLFDPIDGSGNIDVNVSIGTIFSVYRRLSRVGDPATRQDFLQPGNSIIAAGYIIYGSSTMLVYATQRGQGVNGFTLDTSIGEFCLSHKNITTPQVGKIFSVNTGNYNQFPSGIKKYLDICHNKTTQQGTLSLRYVSSMIADIHRNLIKGGVFLYPPTHDKPNGKLRLMYECNPMAFIVEKAGGLATNGSQRILDIQPSQIHQRTPLYIGSKKMVEEISSLL